MLPESIPPSQNLPRSLRIYPLPLDMRPPPPFSTHPSRIYRLLSHYMQRSHNLTLPSRIYPLLYQVGLLECTPSFQNIPPFSTTTVITGRYRATFYFILSSCAIYNRCGIYGSWSLINLSDMSDRSDESTELWKVSSFVIALAPLWPMPWV